MDSILLQKHQELIGHLEGNLYRTSPIISSDWESEEENVSVKKRGRGRPKKDEFTPKKKINARTNEFNELDSDARDEEKDRKHHMLQSKREKRRCGSPDHKSLSATSSVEWTSMVPGSPDISSSMSSLPDSLPIMSSNSRSTPCFYQQCSLYLQDSGSLLLPSKFEGFPIRACKKHAEGWRSSSGLCEICHGMNSAEFEVPKQYTNSQDNVFHLCGSCAKRQRKVLNLHQEESVSDNDSQYGMSDPETISDRSPNTAVVQNETQPQKQAAKGPVKLDASGERYLDHFEKIEQWNRSNMNESEVNSTAFRWFATVGFEILQSKGKVTIPIEYRLPAKKGLANNFKGGNVDELFGRNPHEWGYVVQLEALDLVRAREDCWVTFKAGHEWNPYAFHDALIAWNKQLGEGWQPVLLPPPPPRVQEPQHIEPKEHIASPDTGYHKQRKEVKKKEKKEYEPVAITSKIEAMQMQAERIKPKLDEIPFGDVILSNNGTGDKKSLTTGRHGAVYKGMWKGYPVAVRFPLVKLPIAESDRNTFLKTVEKVSKATHPNLVANYACCASDQLCILSEFMNIGNLQDFLTSFSSEITEMYFAKIASDIARAMDHIHSKGILHCNLSSKNVMLKGEVIDGGIIAALEVKVADVGFNSSLETRLDSTDPYLAPEVLNSQMHTSFSDVYSFGKILCYLFSDRSEPLPVEDLKKNGVDSRWIEIIQQCLHTVPEQRPTFGQILNILTSMNQRNRS